jgi:signal transduction histidine kinase
MGATGDFERVRRQLDRLSSIERRYREMLLGNPIHPQGDGLRSLLRDGDFGVTWIAERDSHAGLQIRTSVGTETDALDNLAISSGEGLTGKVFRSGEIDWVDAYFEAPSITHSFDAQIRVEGVERLIAVPLIDAGTVVGVLAAGSRTPGLFGGVAVDHLVSTAGSIALRGIIADRERRLAERIASEERRRIAMDLHDSVGAMLYSIGSDAKGLRDALDLADGADSLTKARLDRITEQTAQASTQLRQALRALHSTRGELALSASLDADCRAFETRSGIPCHVSVMTDVPELPDATVALLIRSLREALLNVEKHAHARTVAVTVSVDAGWFTLTVTDDGTGMSAPRTESTATGLGLATVEVEVGRLGGRLDIRSEDDGGTVWRLRVPA